MLARLPAFFNEQYAAAEQKVSSVFQSIKNNYYVTKSIEFGNWVVSENNIQNFLNGFAQPFLHLPEALVAIKKSNKVRAVLGQTMKSGAPILVTSFIYYNGVRPYVLQPFANDDVLQVSDNAMFGYLLTQVPRLFVEDAINSVSLADTFTDLMPKKTKHFECDCSDLDKRHGNFNTNIHYVTHSVMLFTLSYLKYVGDGIDILFTPWFIGQSNMDYRLNMCDPHRYRLISRNNFYLAGMGAAVQLGALAVSHLIGVDRKISGLAVRTFVMKLGMLTTVLREDQLPGNERTWDVSYYLRYAGMHFVQNRANDLNHYLKQKRIAQKIMELKKTNNKGYFRFGESKAELAKTNLTATKSEKEVSDQLFGLFKNSVSWWVTKLIGSDYAHLQSLVRTGPIKLLIQTKKEQIFLALNAIQGAQQHPALVVAAVKVSNWLPQNFMPSGVTNDDLRFFKRVVFLNGVKRALPMVAELVGHALKDPSILVEDEVLTQKLLEEAEQEHKKLIETMPDGWGESVIKASEPKEPLIFVLPDQPVIDERRSQANTTSTIEEIEDSTTIINDQLSSSLMADSFVAVPSPNARNVIAIVDRQDVVENKKDVIENKNDTEFDAAVINPVANQRSAFSILPMVINEDYYDKPKEIVITSRPKNNTPLQTHSQFSATLNTVARVATDFASDSPNIIKGLGKTVCKTLGGK